MMTAQDVRHWSAGRHPFRFCEACLQYDDHPRYVLAVTTSGPLGLHTPGEVAAVSEFIRPKLPTNFDELEIRLRGLTPAEREQVYLAMVPDVEEYDAARAWHQFMHPDHYDVHFDCYLALPAELQPQMAVHHVNADGVVTSFEDKTKLMPSDHALAGIKSGLQGDELRAHLTADPAIGD